MAQAQAGNYGYLANLDLKGIRGFKDFALNFTKPQGKPRMRTLVIGRNGTNKTTLLRCIVLGLVPFPDALSLLGFPNGTLTNGKYKSGSITSRFFLGESSEYKGSHLSLVNNKNARLKNREDIIDLSGEDDYHRDNFIVAYGTSRSMVGFDSSREYRAHDSVQSLFQNEARLHSTELTLRRMKDYKGMDLYKSVVPRIIKAFQLLEETTIALPKGGGIEISGPEIGGAIPIEGWADGYRLTFQWIIDLYAWAMRAGQISEEGSIRGILLIDEIEQHLHPSLQTGLLDKLSLIFPELQIIATTHSPMVALGVKPEELVVLRRNGGKVEMVQNIPDYRGYSVEDIIADDLLFDSPIFSPEVTAKLERFEELAANPAQTRGLDNSELADLAKELQQTADLQNNDDVIIRKLEEIEKKLK